VRIVSQYDGQVADDTGGSLSDGAAVIQFPPNDGPNQNWALVPAT
jgi:hypothetical protein